ncbi:MAG TPA: cell cycle transcriptional regulator TrcR, partial [Kiloniellales bacterium]|nr:cell cycle transcriptional regulator TrcR [Kiloniellales bacterium]
MAQPLMPKATAVWLVENTALTFDQIAEFCGLHPLEVQGIADGEVAIGIQGLDPVARNQLTRDEIARCEKNPSARLKMAKQDLPKPMKRTKGPRYTPVAKRQDKPDGIAWLLRHHPELKDSQIARLIGTTKTTIQAVRERTHWNSPNIRPRDPVLLGLCGQSDLNQAVERARKAAARAGVKLPEAPAPQPEMPAESGV